MRVFSFIAVVLLGLMSGPSALAQLQLRPIEAQAGSYIVNFTAPPKSLVDAKDKAERRQIMVDLRSRVSTLTAKLREDLKATDLLIKRELWLRQAVSVSLSPEYIEQASALSYVEKIEVNQKYQAKPQGTLVLPTETVQVNDQIQRLDIDELWKDGYRGQGVVVAILDTGVDVNHVDLKDRWRGGTNSWFDPYSEYDTPTDDLDSGGNAHGTGVTSLVLGGNKNNKDKYLGLAPDAMWIAARVLNDADTDEGKISEALQWVLDPDGNPATDDAPDIVQNSWGLTDTGVKCPQSPPFAGELEAINAAGIDIVFSVGNVSGAGPETYLLPSSNPNVISVGAVTDSDIVWANSARGPDACAADDDPSAIQIPTLAAPGVQILVAEKVIGKDDQTYTADGTSFSAPMVSGALALLRSKYAANNHLAYREALIDTADTLGGTAPNPDTGYGVAQASAAAQAMAANTALRPDRIEFSSAQLKEFETRGSVTVTVIRSGNIANAAEVFVTASNQSARAGVDYIGVRNQLITFFAGESKKTFNITLIDDSNSEGDEVFNLALSASLTSSVVLGDRAQIAVTIIDDETTPDLGTGSTDPNAPAEDEIGGNPIGLPMLLGLALLLFARRRLQ